VRDGEDVDKVRIRRDPSEQRINKGGKTPQRLDVGIVGELRQVDEAEHDRDVVDVVAEAVDCALEGDRAGRSHQRDQDLTESALGASQDGSWWTQADGVRYFDVHGPAFPVRLGATIERCRWRTQPPRVSAI